MRKKRGPKKALILRVEPGALGGTYIVHWRGLYYGARPNRRYRLWATDELDAYLRMQAVLRERGYVIGGEQ